jgi:hypothetical protein
MNTGAMTSFLFSSSDNSNNFQIVGKLPSAKVEEPFVGVRVSTGLF